MQRQATSDDAAAADHGPPVPERAPRYTHDLRYRFKVGIRRPTTTLGLLGLVLFGYLIVVPIATMLIEAATVSPCVRTVRSGASGGS